MAITSIAGSTGITGVTAMAVEEYLSRYVSSTTLTAQAYRGELALAARQAACWGTELLGLTRPLIQAYITLMVKQGLQPATIARRLTAVCGLLRYAYEQGYLAVDPTVGIRRPNVPVHSQNLGLTPVELAAMVRAGQQHSPRAAAMITLMCLGGLRVGEVVGADAHDLWVRGDTQLLTIRRKGGARVAVPLAMTTVAALDGYLQGRTEGALLLSRTGRRLDRSAAGRLFKSIASQCLEPGSAARVTCHSARHGWTSALVGLGVPIQRVAAAAGHSDVRSTIRYLHELHVRESHPTYQLDLALSALGTY